MFETNNIIKILSNIVTLTLLLQIIMILLILTYNDSYKWINWIKVILLITTAICSIIFFVYDYFYENKVREIILEKEHI